MLNFIRVAAAVPRLEVADPAFNTNEIIKLYRQAAEKQSAAVVFPELSITGYSCGDLFEHPRLLDAAKEALKKLVSATCGCSSIHFIKGAVGGGTWYSYGKRTEGASPAFRFG